MQISDSFTINDCWNKIGVFGDRTCPELSTHIHCRNCPVYSAAGRGLLEREAPSGYIHQWTDLLAQTSPSEATQAEVMQGEKTLSVIIFRLGQEWLALPAKLFKEVTQPSVIHTIPHRSNDVILGIVSIRGEITLCISLKSLLGLQNKSTNAKNLSSLALSPILGQDNQRLTDNSPNPKQQGSPVVYERMVVVEVDAQHWVFHVDEIYSIQRFHPQELRDAPAVIAKATETYTKGVINWQNKKVNYLDSDLLFYSLNRRLEQ